MVFQKYIFHIEYLRFVDPCVICTYVYAFDE